MLIRSHFWPVGCLRIMTSDLQARRREELDLFAALYPQLRRFAAVVADSDQEPDDLVQEALAKVLRRTSLTDLSHPAAYLKRTVLNLVANDRRRKGRYRQILPRLGLDEAMSDNYPSDISFLDELSPTDRAVIYLADVDGYSLSDIATELGLSAGAVRKRASRARANLRERTSDEPEPAT